MLYRWQERANQLIERTNKNPDELKRLTLEKENLTKQMGVEREQTRVARVKLEEQVGNYIYSFRESTPLKTVDVVRRYMKLKCKFITVY